MTKTFAARCLGTFLLALALALPAHALEDLPEGVTEVTSVEGISEYRLENGLRVLLFPDATKPTVTVNLTYLVGSRHEGYGETGMAHLLEHLLFKGTPTHEDIPGEMRRRGIRYNASTWYDRTNYFGSFAAGEDNLDWLLALEADRMVNSDVAREDLESEMTVVRNEMERGETDPFRVLWSRLTSTAYLWHNYGNSTIGARADVENMPIEALQDFYRRYYRPDNATLLVAGRIDPAEALARVVRHFGPLERPDEPVPQTYTAEPTQDGEREVTVRRVGETRLVGLAYHIPASAHADTAALQVLGQVLGDTPSGRLHESLVETGLATSVSASPWLLAEPGMFLSFAMVPSEGDPEATAEALVAGLEDAAEVPFTEDEVARAKAKLLKNIELLFNDANSTAMSLSEAIAAGDWRLFFLRRDRIGAVTVEDVERVSKHYFKRANRTLARFVPTESPDRAEIPEAPEVASLVEGYEGREAVAAGEAFDPSPANIDARTITGELSNGTEVALLPKQTRGDTIALSLQFRFGSIDDVTGRDVAAGMVASMLTRGTQNLDREQISRRLDELKSRVSIGGGSQSVGVGATTTREHLPEFLALLAEILKSPAFPAEEFEQLRSQAITGLETGRNQPQSVASRALTRHFSPWPKGHPWYVGTLDEEIAGVQDVSLDQVRAFHADFYGAGSGEISLVGDFDAEETKALLEKHFGDWTTDKPYVRLADPANPPEAVVRNLKTPDQANAAVYRRAEMPVSDSHPDYPALVVANNILGGGGMKSRLGDRVRQAEGLSYSVGSRFGADVLDPHATLSLFAIAAPENVAKVRTAFDEELARFFEEGVTEAELKDAVDGILKSWVMSRAEDGNLSSLLRSNLQYDRTLERSAKLEAKLASLTKDEVDQAIREHFAKAAMSDFAAGDF
ncbi:MAG TPA: pitrilysin family protein [Arenimonas sp.]|nr:pitrilysin family protein [Arenimonas sp.]